MISHVLHHAAGLVMAAVCLAFCAYAVLPAWLAARAARRHRSQREATLRREVAKALARQDRALASQGLQIVRRGSLLVMRRPVTNRLMRSELN